jgi:ATP-binding protein involved in chromosome partitioning
MSTVSDYFAMTLSKQGYNVGLLDADLFGPSIPLLFGLHGKKPMVKEDKGKHYLIPFVKNGIKLMSIGFLVEAQQAVVWRGPRVSSAITQLLTETYWGNLDYLIIDTPPGTGDIHITLLQNFETSGVIIVTTPQLMSLADVRKSIDLYQNNKLSTPILGIVENMSWFTPTKHPDEKYFLFGKGGGDELVKQFNIPLLAQIPFNEFICQTCDKGNLEKMLLDENVKTAFLSLAENLFSKIRIYQ